MAILRKKSSNIFLNGVLDGVLNGETHGETHSKSNKKTHHDDGRKGGQALQQECREALQEGAPRDFLWSWHEAEFAGTFSPWKYFDCILYVTCHDKIRGVCECCRNRWMEVLQWSPAAHCDPKLHEKHFCLILYMCLPTLSLTSMFMLSYILDLSMYMSVIVISMYFYIDIWHNLFLYSCSCSYSLYSSYLWY